MRRVFADGGFAAVMRRGAAEAGAIFVVVRGRLGEFALFGPAPQAGYEEVRPAERVFVRLVAENEEAIDARLAREAKFDTDLWVMEIEPGKTPVEALLPLMPG